MHYYEPASAERTLCTYNLSIDRQRAYCYLPKGGMGREAISALWVDAEPRARQRCALD
jgi:hypothetical protein